MKFRSLATLAVLIAAAQVCNALHAGTVNLQLVLPPGNGGIVQISQSNVISSVFAGVLKVSVTSTNGTVITPGTYFGFCSELAQSPNTGSQVYQEVDVANLTIPGGPVGTGVADAIKRIFQYGYSAQGTDISVWGSELAKAVQVAIWEFVEDGWGLSGAALNNAIDLSSGKFELVSGVNAGVMTNVLNAAKDFNGVAALSVLGYGNRNYQDYILDPGFGGEVGMLPEPASASLWLLGVAGLVGLRMRRKS